MFSKTIFAYGDSAAGRIRQILGSRNDMAVTSCVEDFSQGPLTTLTSMQRFSEVRANYWESRAGKPSSNDWLTDFHRHLTKAHQADRVEVWVGSTVQEQFFLLFFNACLYSANIDRQKVFVVQFPNDHEILSLSMYSDDMLMKRPSPQPLTEENSEKLRTIWEAIVEGSWETLNQVAAPREMNCPIDEAIRVFLRRFPDRRTGLGTVDVRILMSLSEEWTPVARIISYVLSRYLHDPDQIGDATMFAHIRRLAKSGLRSPLVQLRGVETAIRDCRARITPFGRKCLSGEANAVSENGIDEKISGFKLSSSTGSSLYWDKGKLVLVDS